MNQISNSEVDALVRSAFTDANIYISDIQIRDYPDESIILVRVDENDITKAIDIANSLDDVLTAREFDGFVTVKKANKSTTNAKPGRLENLLDARVTEFSNLLVSRSRTSEAQPSLKYIRDANSHLDAVISSRHHLIFGRRGSGKTALLAEVKSRCQSEDDFTVWLNSQTHRHEPIDRFFLTICMRICEVVQVAARKSRLTDRLSTLANILVSDVDILLRDELPTHIRVVALIPRVQEVVRRLTTESGKRLLVFLDDLHYLPRLDQPMLLDMVHGTVRDCDAWLKIATIQHLTQWYDSSRLIGLQTGHDASHVDLDLSLQNPLEAKHFLEALLSSYAEHCDLRTVAKIFAQRGAMDRLVIASGAVPRDYLMLCSNAIQIARQRQNAKSVGVQDINVAAGAAKQKKIDELEDDAASASGESASAIATLRKVQEFCLEKTFFTFFRVDFSDKDASPDIYARLQLLIDLRLVHMIEASLSDERIAGRKSEVFLLDLSQFAGSRLKRKLTVLDLHDGNLVLKQTGSKATPRIATTANKKLSILRRAPLLSLEKDLNAPQT
jgi:hypothetical protein